MVEESCFDDLDRSFLSLSSKMSDFFSWTYGMLGYRLVAPLDPNKFDNTTSKIGEIGIRTFIVLGTALSLCFAGTYIILTAVVLGVGSKMFRSIGFAFQKEGFTHVRGQATEKVLENGQASILTWNIRGVGGGLHYEGGVVHWRSRINPIVEEILKESPDVIVLQEIYDTALAETLIAKLGGRYAHFYIHSGANTWGNGDGCMVISKCAIHRFIHTDFTNNDNYRVNRGFDMLEIKAHPQDSAPCLRIIGTQLISGADVKNKRMNQITQIVDGLAKQTLPLPTLFVGSLHAHRDDEEEGSFLSGYLSHSYRDEDPTRSDRLAIQWNPDLQEQEESSDFISLFKRYTSDGKVLPVIEKNIRYLECRLVRGFDQEYNTKTALSDHHAVVTRMSGLKPIEA